MSDEITVRLSIAQAKVLISIERGIGPINGALSPIAEALAAHTRAQIAKVLTAHDRNQTEAELGLPWEAINAEHDGLWDVWTANRVIRGATLEMAHLMAAAPEWKAVGEKVESVVQRYRRKTGGKDGWVGMYDAMELIAAARAKERGDS